jgi:hypothetical protein
MVFMENEARVLVLKGKAGLGNRLLSVLGGILYCQLHKRLLCVDWTDGTYASKGEDAFQMAFRCDFPTIALSRIDAIGDIHPPLWRGNLSLSVTEMIDKFHPNYWNDETAVFSNYSIRFRSESLSDKVVVRWSYHDDLGEFFSQLGMTWYTEKRRFFVLRGTLRKYLSFESELLMELEARSSEQLSGKTIGIHIRYTDNKAPLKVLLSRLDRLSREHIDAKIFLSTDSSAIEEKLRLLYPDRIIKTDKTRISQHEPLHRQGLRDEARESALLDMYLLSRCDFLIYSSRSTFGYCAALLSIQPVDRLYDCLEVWQRLKRELVSLKWNALRYFS